MPEQYSLTDNDLQSLQSLVSDLRTSLIDRAEHDDEVAADLRARFDETDDKGRTADSFTEWREKFTEEVAVAWVLTTIFVRYMEDNGLVDEIRIAGTGDADAEVEDRWRAFIDDNPTASETDYLLHIFERLGKLRAGGLFRPERNDLYKMKLPGDAGRQLLKFFRETDPDTGKLLYDFTAEGGDTRFLGDLYQDLSQDARERYALLQTPEFVEEFILDQTLEPAIDTFGIDEVRFIDPTCGSGHFLLGGFRRILGHLREKRPDLEPSRRVRQALEATHGVDINPFAVSIARFRLLVAALHEISGPDQTLRLDQAPNIPLKIATGDSLLLGRQFPRWEKDIDEVLGNQTTLDQYAVQIEGETSEDYDLIYGDAYASSPGQTTSSPTRLGRSRSEAEGEGPPRKPAGPDIGILMQQYHAVVGNPPYITVKDKAANSNYRKHYESCYYQYSMVCPFYERFFDLAGGTRVGEEQFELGDDPDDTWPHTDAGYVGMIVGNSFMKRRFGQKLIEEILPETDLTHVVDTSGAYIPGHGTPTAILAGRNQAPKTEKVRAALGIRGEPDVPDVPAEAKVWSSIEKWIAEPGFENEFVTITDVERDIFHEHPWSLRGGGVLDAKERIETGKDCELTEVIEDQGFGAVTREDAAYMVGASTCHRKDIEPFANEFVTGEGLRGWRCRFTTRTIWPYDRETLEAHSNAATLKFLWRDRARLTVRSAYGKTQLEHGLTWFEFSMFFEDRYPPPTISFAEVATHNHFYLDREGLLFKRTAPLIKLPEDVTEEDHLELLGPLNSSTGCFWMKQVFFAKGGDKMKGGARRAVESWHDRYQRDGTKMKLFPLPEERPVELPRRLDALGQKMADLQPREIAESDVPTADRLDEARDRREEILGEMIALQEELDWKFYEIYGLVDETPKAPDFYDQGGADDAYDALPQVRLGERPFEIALARRMEAGDVKTSWFERHGSEPKTEIPDRWPDWYQQLVDARLEAIENERFVKLIEDPEFKRRWNLDDWEDLEEEALENWLKGRLETARYIPQAPDATTLTQSTEATTPGDDGEHGNHNLPAGGEVPERSGGGGGERTTRHTSDEPPRLTTVAKLAHKAREDDDFNQVARRLTGDPAVDIEALVTDLVEEESTPYLPSQRYNKTGIDRRKEWEKVWDLQRIEDGTPTAAETFNHTPDHLEEVEDKLREIYGVPETPDTTSPGGEVAERSEVDGGVEQPANPTSPGGEVAERSEVAPQTSSPGGEVAERSEVDGGVEQPAEDIELEIPKPPKYRKKDYAQSHVYYLRGKLDVPKERFISYPGLEGEDGSMVVSWAGFDHLQRAKALATFYYEARNQRGWGQDRLVPILAGLKDLLPWVNQWHPEPDDRTGEPFGEFLKNMIESQCQALGVGMGDVEEKRVDP